MSLPEIAAAHVDSVFFNTAHHAETLTRNVDGKNDQTESFPAIVDWIVETDDTRGQASYRRGVVGIPDSKTVTVRDSIMLGGYTAEITHPPTTQNGMTVFRVLQYLPETKGARPVRTGDI